MKFGTNVAHWMTIPQNSSKLKIVAMETYKCGIADFEAIFGPEGLTFSYQNQLKFKSESAANF